MFKIEKGNINDENSYELTYTNKTNKIKKIRYISNIINDLVSKNIISLCKWYSVNDIQLKENIIQEKPLAQINIIETDLYDIIQNNLTGLSLINILLITNYNINNAFCGYIVNENENQYKITIYTSKCKIIFSSYLINNIHFTKEFLTYYFPKYYQIDLKNKRCLLFNKDKILKYTNNEILKKHDYKSSNLNKDITLDLTKHYHELGSYLDDLSMDDVNDLYDGSNIINNKHFQIPFENDIVRTLYSFYISLDKINKLKFDEFINT